MVHFHAKRAAGLLVLLAVLVLAAPAGADTPETALVARVPFGDAIEVEGSFGPAETSELKIELDAYKGALEVEEAVAEGPVEEGQVLVRFRGKDLDTQIESLTLDLSLQRMGFQSKQRARQRLEREMAVRRKEIERKLARAEDDLAYFLEIDKPMRLAESAHQIQGFKNRVEDQKEELRQLEKMYGADDLTEETEEIVLMRARRGLARTLKSLEFREIRRARWLSTTLPRDEENKRLALDKTRIEHEKSTSELNDQDAKSVAELRKAEIGLVAKEESLAKLKGDAEKLTVRAPVSGYAFAGSYADGWKGRSAALARLAPGERVKAGTTLMTVVPAGGLIVKTAVEEKDLFQVEVGLPAAVAPGANPSLSLRAVVESVAPVGAGKKYDVRLRLVDADARITPGMTCTVSILANTGEAALCVPASAVLMKDAQSVVFVVGDDGAAVEVPVVPGQAKAGLVSIDTGELKAGQLVLLSPPQEGEGE